MGFSVPPRLLSGRWALTPPFHPYPSTTLGAVCFLWHSPSRCLTASLPHISPPDDQKTAKTGYAASRPLVFGLSSPSLRRERFSALPKPVRTYVLGRGTQGGDCGPTGSHAANPEKPMAGGRLRSKSGTTRQWPGRWRFDVRRGLEPIETGHRDLPAAQSSAARLMSRV